MKIRCTRLALASAALLYGLAQAQSVTPPPLPIGSQMARPEPGMSEPEAKRAIRAHHHKFHHGKDVTRDDSVLGHESVAGEAVRPVVTRGAGAAAARGTAAGTGAAGAGAASVQGGAGTGPAREKTDKGASSYFFGNDKK
jgi:hypothetical protein